VDDSNDDRLAHLSRRAVTTGIGGGALAPGALIAAPAAASVRAQPAWPGAVLATPDQQSVERWAVEIWNMPRVQAARQALEPLFLDTPSGRRPAGLATWQSARDQIMFGFILRTVTESDPQTPHILTDCVPAHDWFGFETPCSFGTGNNPDNVYRRIGMHADARYEIRGRLFAPGPGDTTLEVNPDGGGAGPKQVAWDALGPVLFSFADLHAEPDGSFLITVDSDPAGGRPNHLRLREGAARMSLRDTLLDWARENPVYFEIRRVDRFTPQPKSTDQIADLVVAELPEFIRFWNSFTETVFFGRAPNTARPPVRGVEVTGLGTKLTTRGNYDLAEDEALVIHADRMDATYMCLALQNCWLQTEEFRSRTGSLNNTQAVPNADGSFTYVVSAQDPGVHNWGDTSGHLQGSLQIRWQGFPHGPRALTEDSVKITRVKLSELGAVLHQDVRAVSAAERAQQLAARTAAFDRRYPRNVTRRG